MGTKRQVVVEIEDIHGYLLASRIGVAVVGEGNITTGPSGIGAPNVSHWSVTIRDREYRGRLVEGDARKHLTVCTQDKSLLTWGRKHN